MTPMDAETELALVEQLRRGDEAAFDVVYDAFNLRLFTFLLRLSRRHDVAEDLLEEVPDFAILQSPVPEVAALVAVLRVVTM